MYFKQECPHCSKTLKVREEQAGCKCRCPYCKTSFIVPVPSHIGLESDSPNLEDNEPGGGLPDIKPGSMSKRSAQAASTAMSSVTAPAATAATAGMHHSSDGSSVSLVKSGLIGFACAALLFAALYPLKLMGIRIGSMFWDSASINFPTTLLMFWSFAILGLKSRQLARQKSAMLLDLLPNEISQEITLKSLDKFVAHIQSLPPEARESILVNRVLRGIEHFRVRKSAAETVTMMESQSAIDAANVAGSYTIVKVFIWAMPILGFIGTVMGVSSAVSGLSATLENAADVSAVTSSMKSVFSGLGTAFDTTLLALIMSMLVKIPASAMQKSEDSLVTIADEYCNENLLRRLNDGRDGGAERRSGGQSIDAEVFREAVEAAMATHHAELEQWLKKLDTVGSKLTSQAARGWSELNTKMQELQEEQLARFQEQSAEHAAQLQQQLQEMGEVAAGIHEKLAELTAQAAATQSDVSESLSGSNEALQTHFAGLERGLNGLSSVLESLGQQQVIVQQVEPPRRGWFGRKPVTNGRK